MAEITAALVKELREMTGAGMMECKKALAEVEGDMEKAIDVLRTRGLAAAAKKAGRATNEGTVAALLSDDAKSGVVLELNCETDFVGMNEKFKAYADRMAKVALDNKISDVDALKAAADADGYQVFKMPWSINFSTGFNITEDTSKPINRKNMRYPYKFSLNSLNINGNVKLTNKWAVSFNSGYDFNAKEITQTAFNITRDLHCFSMTAAISPFGRWKYYNFTIRANASILQDLKWEQRSQTQSNIQWY